MQNLRIEPNKEDLLRLIEQYDYPNKAWLTNTWMLDYSLVSKVWEGDDLVAAIWGHWVDPGVLAVHVLVLPGQRMDWRGIMPQLMTAADFLGADEIALSFEGIPRAKAMERLVQALGFEPQPENPYGTTTLFRRATHERTHAQAPETPEAGH